VGLSERERGDVARDSRHCPDAFEPLLERVTRVAHGANEEEEQREAAELLHALGTSEALRRTIVDINGLPQLTESSVCDPPAPTIWEGARLDRAPRLDSADWRVLIMTGFWP